MKKALIYLFLLSSILSFAQKDEINLLQEKLAHATTDSSIIDLSIPLITAYAPFDIDSSLIYYDLAFDLAEKNKYYKRMIKAQMKITARLMDKGDYTKAKLYIDKGLKLGHHLNNDMFICESLISLFTWHWELSNTKQSLETLHEALKYAEKAQDLKYRAMVLASFGLFYESSSDKKLMQEYHLEAYDLYVKINDTPNQSIILHNLASHFFEEKIYSKALDYINRSLHLLDRSPIKHPTIYEHFRALKGEILFHIGEKEEGFATLEYAINWATKSSDARGLVHFNKTKANWLYDEGKYDEAILAAKIAVNTINKTGYLKLLPKLCKILNKCYKEKKDYKSSLYWAEEEIKAKTELAHRENNREAIKLEANYHLKEKEMENQALMLKNRNQSILTGGIALIGLLSFLFLFYFLRKKQEKELNKFRQRVSNNLHDDVGSDLNGIIRSVKGLKSISDNQNINTKVDELVEKSNQVIRNMVDVIWTMDNNNSTVGDLVTKMEDHLDEVKTLEKNIQIQFLKKNLNQNKSLPIHVKHHLLMIFKESINNIQKHTTSSNINVELKNINQKFHMTIANQFSEEKEPINSSGRGIVNIRRRIVELGGKVEVQKNKNNFVIDLHLEKPL